MFQVNKVYQLDHVLFRILKIYPQYLVWIDIQSNKALPELFPISELEQHVIASQAQLAHDPFSDLSLFSVDTGSIYQIKRDHNFAIIKRIIEHERFYDPKERAYLIEQLVQQKIATKQTIYRLLRCYWQRGMTPNALIPQYYNSGGKGIKKTVTEKKLGRPRIISVGTGALIDKNVEKLFKKVINQYLLNDKKISIKYAYRKFLILYQEEYPDIPKTEYPSFWQFKYFYERDFSRTFRLKKRSPQIQYLKDNRPLLSTTNSQVSGPGSRYQIDATIADIYLISDSDRSCIIGRPTVYFMIDEFSRMVTGIYVGLENPSYVTSMQVLRVAMCDKVKYCQSFGREIRSEDWPCIGLPEAILADRGELLGHQIEHLEKSFAIRIENAPAYRGDLKGIIERYFRTIQADFKPYAPGVVQPIKEKKRGGKDYRLDATLTIHEFTKIILNSVLMHNQTHEIRSYDRDIDMPTDLPNIPLHLWNWGIQNRTGKLRTASERLIYIALLPRTEATLSHLGLKVFGVYYICKEILENGWMHRSTSIQRPQKLTIAYDPANAEKIYVFFSQSNSEYWEAQLAQRSREFIGCSFWEVWKVKKEQKSSQANYHTSLQIARAELERSNEEIIQKALESTRQSTRSNADRLSTIKENRIKARDQEREVLKESVPTCKSNQERPSNIVSFSKGKAHTDDQDQYDRPAFFDQLFDDD